MFTSVFLHHHIQKLYWKDDTCNEALQTISPALSSMWKLRITGKGIVSEQECDFHMAHCNPNTCDMYCNEWQILYGL
jgi:hypothetical protein